MKDSKNRSTVNIAAMDYVGLIASGVCMVHCVALPFLISFLPAFGVRAFAEDGFHRVLGVSLVLISLGAFLPGFRVHREGIVFFWVLPGLTSIILSVYSSPYVIDYSWRIPMNIFGGLCLMRAHYLNRSFCDRCRHCSHG